VEGWGGVRGSPTTSIRPLKVTANIALSSGGCALACPLFSASALSYEVSCEYGAF